MSIPLTSPVVAKPIRGICCASRIAPTARSSTAHLPMSVIVPQRQSHRFDLRGGTMTDIGKCAVEDLAVGAIRLAQQMPRIRFATTGDVRGIDIHSGYDNNIFTD